MRAAYATLRDHAREREIPFTIGFEDFERFALQSKYLQQTGLSAASITVDRRDNLQGYVRGNLQPLTRSANSIKRAKQDAIRLQAGFSWQGRGV